MARMNPVGLLLSAALAACASAPAARHRPVATISAPTAIASPQSARTCAVDKTLLVLAAFAGRNPNELAPPPLARGCLRRSPSLVLTTAHPR